MHARIDQLLSVLDREPVDAAVHAHIEQCASCTAHLQQLLQTTQQLHALAQLEPPEDAWQQIVAQLPGGARVRPWWQRRVTLAAMASAVVLLMTVLLWRGQLPGEPTARARAAAPAVRVGNAVQGPAYTRQLMAVSRQLEAKLASLPQRPAVERPAMAVTVDNIEQRLQWLDWQTAAPEGELSAEQIQTLWSERVTLMDSLVKLRYAESDYLIF